MKKRQKTSRQSGQATIEMVLTLTLLISFVFFQVQVALVMAYGNFVHYATFMAARAYLSGGNTDEDSRQRAADVIIEMLKKSKGQSGTDRWPGIAKSAGDGDVRAGGAEIGVASDATSAGKDGSSWMVGVRYTFKSRLFFFSLGSKSDGNLTLTSESWLGQDPSYSSCRENLSGKRATLLDNGC